ncbi:LytTR family DNA-binding domain-containing protein [Sphingobacterium siyangense]|uniref:LytR/AlgR family response regulator transcription factor n=1 Tax=Sphingobacterium siyangense TaxID=459529 RepID=UPI002FDE2976
MRCYIVDDKQFCIDQLTRHILNTVGFELVGSDTDPLRALAAIKSGMLEIDLLFLDIDMPGIDGLEFERQVRGLAIVIFVTGYRKYAVDAFQGYAKAYLLKPVTYAKFSAAIEKVGNSLKREQAGNDGHEVEFAVKINGKNNLKIVRYDSIVYITAADNYMILHLNDNTTLMVNITMKKLMETLPQRIFIRTHHSYAVNKNYVSRIVGNIVKMNNDVSVDISRAYRNDVLQRFKSI